MAMEKYGKLLKMFAMQEVILRGLHFQNVKQILHLIRKAGNNRWKDFCLSRMFTQWV